MDGVLADGRMIKWSILRRVRRRADAPKTKVYRSMIGNGRTSPATRQRVLDYVKKHNCTLDVPACEADIVARTTFHW